MKMTSSKNRNRTKQRQQKEARRKARQSKSVERKQEYRLNKIAADPSENAPKFISIEQGPMTMVAKITGAGPTPDGRNIKVDMTPLEDTILPVPLKFDPPLQAFGTNEKAFSMHWQQITYLFNLDDPIAFSDLRSGLTEDKRTLLTRYIQTCCRLARYSTISGDSSVVLSTNADGESSVHANLPSDEAFVGFSTSFRQLHNKNEKASFTKAWKVLNTALNSLIESDKAPVSDRDALTAWKEARNKLSSKTAPTMICESLVPDSLDEKPLSLKGINPDDLIRTYNYGDTIHWGNNREDYAELTSDPSYEKFYSFCCVSSMVSLSHLYFGFAELIAAALGSKIPAPLPEDS